MPLAGGEETKVAGIPAVDPWFLVRDHSYYYRRKRDGVELHRIDHATNRDTVVRMLPLETAGGIANFTIAPTPESPRPTVKILMKILIAPGRSAMIEQAQENYYNGRTTWFFADSFDDARDREPGSSITFGRTGQARLL